MKIFGRKIQVTLEAIVLLLVKIGRRGIQMVPEYIAMELSWFSLEFSVWGRVSTYLQVPLLFLKNLEKTCPFDSESE